MMSREDAKADAEGAWRWLVPLTLEEDQEMTDHAEPPAWSGAYYAARAERVTPSNGETYNDYTDNPHGPVERRVGEPDSKWLCENGHGPFDAPFEPVVVPRPEPDPVNNPSHYGGVDNTYEAIKVIEAWELGFSLGNTVKYISRAGKKHPDKTIEDLKKAAWYLARHIDNLENDRG